MTTELYIKIDNKWSRIDLFNDIEIPLTMRVSDLATNTKATGFSLDFDIPNTSNNCKIFGLTHELDIYKGSFEVGKNYDAYLTDGGLTTFEGQFRLKKVIKTPTSWHYVGYLYSGVKNFIDALGTSTLCGNDDASLDLNFDEMNTPASEMTLSDFVSRLQMHDTSGEDWALTLIDKTNKFSQNFSSGSQTWYTDQCTPYLYAMAIFNRIIHSAGYDYDSKFLMGTDGNTYLQDPRWADTIGQFDVYSMIYPYMRHNSNIHTTTPTSSTITQNANTSAVLAEAQYYKETTLEEVNLIDRVMHLNTTDFVLNEMNVSSDLTAYQFVAPTNGYYNINWNFNVEGRAMLRNYDNDAPVGFSVVNTQGNKPYAVWVELQKNNSLIGGRVYASGAVTGDYTPYTEYNPDTGLNESYVTLHSGNFHYENQALWLNTGDTLKLYMWVQCPVRYDVYNANTEQYDTKFVWWHDSSQGGTEWHYDYYPKRIQIKLTNAGSDVIVSNTLNDGFYEENPFEPECILNPKTTKLDFFNSFVKMFNLYVEDVSGKPKPDGSGIYPNKCLRIEPYECFYDSNVSDTVDWTDKIDWNSVEYNRVEDYLYNTQKYSFEQNKDFFNEDYNNTWIQDYGCMDVKGPYCTTNEETTIESKLGGYCAGLVNSSTDTIQCPKAFTLNKSNALDTKKEYSDGIFFIWRNRTNIHTQIGTNYTVKLQSRIYPGSSYNITDYQCADVANNGYGDDTATLLWASPQDRTLKNDLYNAFYKKQIDDYTSPNAMVMKALIYLTSFDVTKLKLSDRVIIDGRAWRILELNQWKNEKTPCEIILIKVLN